jgi:hypothetical protein
MLHIIYGGIMLANKNITYDVVGYNEYAVQVELLGEYYTRERAKKAIARVQERILDDDMYIYYVISEVIR